MTPDAWDYDDMHHNKAVRRSASSMSVGSVASRDATPIPSREEICFTVEAESDYSGSPERDFLLMDNSPSVEEISRLPTQEALRFMPVRHENSLALLRASILIRLRRDSCDVCQADVDGLEKANKENAIVKGGSNLWKVFARVWNH